MRTQEHPPARKKWLSPRRKRFWAVLVILAYTLLGFFAAPALIKNSVMSLLQEDLGRTARIGKINANPYALSLRVQDFQIDDTDGVKLAAFDEFYINFQFLSILKWAWTFSRVELHSPYIHFERFANGELRIARLLQDFAGLHPPETAQQEQVSGKVPRLLIRNLVLQNGHVEVVDKLPGTAVEVQLAPINISIRELNTIPDLHGEQHVTIHLPGDAKLGWSGSLSLAPLESKGELVLEDLQLKPLVAYLENEYPIESIEAVLSAQFQYQLGDDANAVFKLDIDDLEVTLEDILASGLTPVTEFVDVQTIALTDGKLRYPGQSLHFGKLGIVNPKLSAWLNEDGSLSVMDLAPEPNESQAAAEQGDASLPWRLGIGEFTIDDGVVSLQDRSVQPKASVELTRLSGKLSHINNEPGVLMPFEFSGGLTEGGTYSLRGKLGVLPDLSLSANVTTNDIPLVLVQPYAQQFAHIVIDGGVVNSELDIDLPAGQAPELGGSLQVPGLEVGNTLDQEKLLGWEKLDINRFELNGDGLHISQLDLENPFARLVIKKDMSTNVAGIVKPSSEDAPSSADAGADAMELVIGGIRVDQGSMDFADFSLPLPFAAHITGLGGHISTIATKSVEPANIQLEGQVDDYGLARIQGSMDMLDPVRHTDVRVEFRNLLMSNLSPYTVAFAGRKIEQGKLDLDLVYGISEGQLTGANDVVLSDLVLGEKVDHPDAASLPLGLAVSLLKDADGVIRIDLPVEGNVNDPEFKIGGVVWQAFTALITKIVSAPFKLLGNLIGVDSEDFGQFEFLAGRSDLTPPELEKVAQLVEALQKRPELVVNINGVSARNTDGAAMKLARLRQAVSQRLETGLGEGQDINMMLDDEVRAVVESLFFERFPDTPPHSLKPAHTAPPAGDPEGKPVFDQLAYASDLWSRLLETETVSDEDLNALARARAEAIREAFLADGSIEQDRVTIGEPKETDSEDGEWVPLELGVASG